MNSTKDLVILCCVSRLFRHEAERKLYTSLNLLVDFSWLLSHSTGRILHTKDSRDRLLDVKRQIVLFRSINTPRLSEIVTNVEIQLIARYPCKRRVKLLSLNRGFRCSCDKLDSELGDALRGLKNLANLWIDCRLCPRSNKEFRHNFLEELQTRSLGVFRISCLCCYWKCNLKPQSPAFKTVHTLEMTPVLRMPPDISFETECAIFPELKTLCTCSSLFMAMVLAGRPIDTVLVMGWDQSMHEAALGSVYQGSLERLSVLTSVTPSFLAIISQNFRPYRNLHQIGRFVDVIDQVSTSLIRSGGLLIIFRGIDCFRHVKNVVYFAQTFYFGNSRHRKCRHGKNKGLSLGPRVSSRDESQTSKSN